jgi:hypothetical protein
MLTRYLPQTESLAEVRPVRRAAAAALRALSRSLGTLARRLSRQDRIRGQRAPVLEFYAEAGAPEGALYIDGVLVGVVPGVNRL